MIKIIGPYKIYFRFHFNEFYGIIGNIVEENIMENLFENSKYPELIGNTILCSKVAKISSTYEKCNSEIKKEYLIKNITLYNELVSKIEEACGSFGTGYPFYALKRDLGGTLPIIEEQIRYNNQLVKESLISKSSIWPCYHCLQVNSEIMSDLKNVCKSCRKIEGPLKPRKVINRLPDMDLWMVCKEDDIPKAIEKLTLLFHEYHLYSSDINPIQTLKDLEEIVNQIEHQRIPEKKLPIDAHIIGYSTLLSLIKQVPLILDQSSKSNDTPYLPIHPLSLRKTWQYDDVAYNFIHDFLSSFTEFNLEEDLQKVLTNVRNIIANNYTLEELYHYLIITGPKSVKDRHKTLSLKDRFEERIESWKK